MTRAPALGGSRIPRERSPDSTWALSVEGYEFVSRRCERHHSDIFEARVLLEPTIFLRGHDAARLIYDEERFRRHGAAPTPMERVLFGQGGVQGLDGGAHRHRKRMFLSLMTPERIGDLTERFRERWRSRIPTWQRADAIVLHEEAGEMLAEAVHAWAGVPLESAEVGERTADLHAMITGAGTVGAGYLRGRRARVRVERRLAEIVDRVRQGELDPPHDSALHVVAGHREADGALLDARVAAVELLNVLRPTVAIDRFVVFCALALHEQPRWRAQVRDDPAARARFVQEVRRYYPFFPFVVARVREDLVWNGYLFPAGRRVMLDLFATDNDPRLWEGPRAFRPERFEDHEPDPFGFVPQGGGDHERHHRCAGEWPTIALLEAAVDLLTGSVTYDVPEQDLGIARGRVPALPRSGFVMRNVRPA